MNDKSKCKKSPLYRLREANKRIKELMKELEELRNTLRSKKHE